uniref:Uncharacterized protein n=1 Tax=Sphaerodactylus townsendi TaxID=933632 RepID=A0ACB8FFB9_9SAUR
MEMRGAVWGVVRAGLTVCALLGPVWGGRQMDKLADRKLCADPECNHEVQGDYYGLQPARLGYFPSSVVQENQYLKPDKTEVKTDKNHHSIAPAFVLGVGAESVMASTFIGTRELKLVKD